MRSARRDLCQESDLMSAIFAIIVFDNIEEHLFAIILRTEGLIIIKENYAWCMKLSLILQRRIMKSEHAYLRVQIVDLNNSGIDVASMDSLSNFYARLYRLLFKGQLDVCFLGELFSSPRIALADQVVHDNEVDVPIDVESAKPSSHCFWKW